MPRNGLGTYVLPAGQPVVTGTTISSSVQNLLGSDLATALTNSVCTDGQSPMLANLSMTSHRITNLSDAVATTDAANLSQITSATTAVQNAIMGRNYLANGSMRVAQRGTTYALTNSVAYGSIDRWFAVMGGTAAGIFNQAAASGGLRPYVAKVGRNNTSTSTGLITIGQVLETAKSIELAGRTVILSFQAYKGADFSSASNNITVKLYYGTGTDQSSADMVAGSWTGSTTPLSTTQAITTTITKYTFTAVIPTTATQIGISIAYTPVGTAGADDNMYITEVQLEQSLNSITTASSFEAISLAAELDECKRWYQLMGIGYMSDASAGAQLVGGISTIPTVPRATPAFAMVTNDYNGITQSNVSAAPSTYASTGKDSVFFLRQALAAGAARFCELISVSAEL